MPSTRQILMGTKPFLWEQLSNQARLPPEHSSKEMCLPCLAKRCCKGGLCSATNVPCKISLINLSLIWCDKEGLQRPLR